MLLKQSKFSLPTYSGLWIFSPQPRMRTSQSYWPLPYGLMPFACEPPIFSPAAHSTILFLFQLLCWKTIQCLIWRNCEKLAARKHNSDWVRSDNENGNGCSCQLITVCPELTNENQFLASMQVDWPSLCCPYTIKKFGEWGFLGEMGQFFVVPPWHLKKLQTPPEEVVGYYNGPPLEEKLGGPWAPWKNVVPLSVQNPC